MMHGEMEYMSFICLWETPSLTHTYADMAAVIREVDHVDSFSLKHTLTQTHAHTGSVMDRWHSLATPAH